MKMPKTVQEFEEAMLFAFKEGLNAGYGIDHENIREEELKASIEFCERHWFRHYGRIYYPPMFDYTKQ